MKNPQVFWLSLLAIGFLALAFFSKEWLFIIGAVIIMIWNQRTLMKKDHLAE